MEPITRQMAADLLRHNGVILCTWARDGNAVAASLLGRLHGFAENGNLDAALYWFRRAALLDDWQGFQGAAESAVRIALEREPENVKAAEVALGWISVALDVLPGWAPPEFPEYLCGLRAELLERYLELADWEWLAAVNVQHDLYGLDQ